MDGSKETSMDYVIMTVSFIFATLPYIWIGLINVILSYVIWHNL